MKKIVYSFLTLCALYINPIFTFKTALPTRNSTRALVSQAAINTPLNKTQLPTQQLPSVLFKVINNNNQPALLYNVTNGKVINGFEGSATSRLILPDQEVQFIINPTANRIQFKILIDEQSGQAYFFDKVVAGENARIIISGKPKGFFSFLFSKFRKAIKKENLTASVTEITANTSNLKSHFGASKQAEDPGKAPAQPANRLFNEEEFIEDNYGKYGAGLAADALST